MIWQLGSFWIAIWGVDGVEMHWVESEESVNYGWHWRQYFGFIGDWYTQLGIFIGWVVEEFDDED